MRFTVFRMQLAVVAGLVLTQFATPLRSFASDSANSVETADPVAQVPPSGLLPSPLLSLSSQNGVFSQYAFLVDKKLRTLTVWQNVDGKLKLVSASPADIGQKDGDKLVEGDKRTPEGVYFFQTTMDGKKLNYDNYGNRIFTLDYPNYFDRLEKKTGTGIWFHAIPDHKSLLRGSRGCVVVRNAVIDHLSQYIELKRTPMVIVDHVEYVDEKQWDTLRKTYFEWLETWRKSWMGKDLEAYLAYYSDRFRANGMNKSRWRKYKQRLAEQYKFIDVTLKDIQIYQQGPKVVFRFLQNYKSDVKEDFGSKILYVLRNGEGRHEIIGESWEPLNETSLTSAGPIENNP